MELLLVRHAIAEEAAGEGPGADARRRLTREGRRRMRLGAAGLRALVPAVELVAASPFVRAVETARIVASAYGLPRSALVTVPALSPGARPAGAALWVGRRRAAGAHGPLALVGHEPHLSRLAALLLGVDRPVFTFKKGGACLIELPPVDRAAAPGVLRWLLGARALRIVGGSDADRT